MNFSLKRAKRIDSVESDDRGRIGLSKAIKAVLERLNISPTAYDVYVDAEGRILLDPRVSIPAREAWLWRNETAKEQLRAGMQDAAEGRIVDGPQFTGSADDDE